MSDLSIVNVVGGGDLHRELDLWQVHSDFLNENIEYDPKTFAGVIIRYKSPRGTVMLFSSGKYNIAGTHSVNEIYDLNSSFVNDVEQMLDEKLNSNFNHRYLVGTGDLGVKLELNEVIPVLGIEQTEYEPEQFPGLFYYPADVNWFCSLFSSGKVVFSGIESEEQLDAAYIKIKDYLSVLI